MASAPALRTVPTKLLLLLRKLAQRPSAPRLAIESPFDPLFTALCEMTYWVCLVNALNALIISTPSPAYTQLLLPNKKIEDNPKSLTPAD